MSKKQASDVIQENKSVTQDNQLPVSLVLEEIPLAELKPHPRNYQTHPEDEIEHLVASIRENGIYKNIVVAREKTILTGHGVAIAAGRAGYTSVPAYRSNLDPFDPRALKLLAGDNEIRHLALRDDRALTELLREFKENEKIGLLGTGYDDMMLASLVMVTRPELEIEDLDAASQWVGLPEYDEGEDRIQITMNFACEEDCQAFCRMLNLGMGKTAVHGAKKSFWWPVRANDDNTSILFASGKKEQIGEA